MTEQDRIKQLEAEVEALKATIADLVPLALMGTDLQDLLADEKDFASVGIRGTREGLLAKLKEIVEEHRPMTLDEFKKLVNWDQLPPV